ncbi:MAG: DUF3784 domain-containing protein [Ilumatobacteraceae bacterium]
MASLQEYVTQQFPKHEIDVVEPRNESDLELTDNTVVSFVVGNRAGLDLLSTFHRSAPNARVAAVEVRPNDRTVVPTSGEDRDGVVDLPNRRAAASVGIGLLVCGAIAILMAWIITDSGMTAAIYGGFAALIGAIVGAIVGGSRFAGERATSQARAPGRSITVVAAFLDDEAEAASLAQSVGPAADYEVRIVDHSGGSRSPVTGNTEP